jgi:sulfatase maturation enzyme AslB (radical SAM superfamily)
MRTVLVQTTKCSLQCPYCKVNNNGRTMNREIMEAAVEAALHKDVALPEIQFFGGEPLQEKELLLDTVKHAARRAVELRRAVRYYLSTNAILIDAGFVKNISRDLFSVEVSIDGSAGPRHIVSNKNGKPYHFKKAVEGASLLMREKIECFANMVVTPETAPFLKRNFEEILYAGFSSVHISPATGLLWTNGDIETLAAQLWDIHGAFLNKNNDIKFLNLDPESATLLLFNREVTVDCDGTVYSGNAYIYSDPEAAARMKLGHVSERLSTTHYYKNRLPLKFYLSNIFPQAVMVQYLVLTRMMNSFAGYVNNQKRTPPCAPE